MHCQSCTAPLDSPDFKGASEQFCKYCTDESGNLKPKAEVQKGIANWFMMWQPGVNFDTAFERAAHFMKAMPAWAEQTASVG